MRQRRVDRGRGRRGCAESTTNSSNRYCTMVQCFSSTAECLKIYAPNQMVRVHSGTVDSYLEEVILHSLHTTADQQAREEVRRQADTINTIAHQFIHT